MRLLFSFALARGYVRSNPALAVELPPDESRTRPVVIHMVAEVARVLHATRGADVT